MIAMIKIRLACPEDADRIETITREQIAEKHEIFDEKRFEWGMLRRLYDPLQRNGFFIAENQTNDVVGISFAELRVDPFGESEAYIKQLFVKKTYRNKGIGKQLLTHIITHLKQMEIQKIQAFLSMDYNELTQMYKNLNFKEKFKIFELSLKE